MDSWVVAHSPHDVCAAFLYRKHTLTVIAHRIQESIYGQIVEILVVSETDANLAVAVLDVFDLKAACHPLFSMPVLARSSAQALYTIVPVKVSPFIKRCGQAGN